MLILSGCSLLAVNGNVVRHSTCLPLSELLEVIRIFLSALSTIQQTAEAI